jgi:hypothetical protein
MPQLEDNFVQVIIDHTADPNQDGKTAALAACPNPIRHAIC